MEGLQKRHRQEQKDLQSRITQKKKSATKKTRKGVNDECTELERQLKEKQDLELSTVSCAAGNDSQPSVGDQVADNDEPRGESVNGSRLEHDMKNLTVSHSEPKDEPIKRPNRQKARLARRAAEQESMATEAAKEAESLPDFRKQESDAMRTQYSARGLREHEIRSDGHCLYAAVADQLSTLRLPLIPRDPPSDMSPLIEKSIVPYKSTRIVAASYIRHHSDDFEPFLEEPLEDYLLKVQYTGEWGGHLELLALARAYGVDINVLQSNGQVEKIEPGTDEGTKPTLWLAYYHHNFGLGEHYNSLRPAG
ncbi:MAG: hypothetical protein LQ348_002527 [Seirophora lacunosa]|nr:MAG: hypothetical protein LQ348_002527 [Seirophora lacunosa]